MTTPTTSTTPRSCYMDNSFEWVRQHNLYNASSIGFYVVCLLDLTKPAFARHRLFDLLIGVTQQVEQE
jgi:hypothetical protein